MTESRVDYVDTEFSEPRGELEKSVARILADVLGIDRIGREDSFYDFGGTSLQAIRVCARIEQELSLKAQPIWLFTDDVFTSFTQRLRAGTEPADA